VSGSLALDAGTRTLDGGRTLLGGDPPRALVLTEAGARVVRELAAGAPPSTPGARALARRLLDAGLAHPVALATAPVAQVTVVVPVRDRPGALARCLSGLGDARALVVDDGSRDPAAVADVCARHGARLVRRPSPGGPAAARNCALPEVTTPLVAFLDSDCVPEPGWLERLCGVLAADPELAGVGPRVRPVAAGHAAGPVARFAAARSPLDLGARPAPVRPGGRVAYLPTAALLVRREALAEGFDSALRYGEDVDLVWRLTDAGARLRYEPAAVVRHAEPDRLRALLARRYRYGTSGGPLARRHPGRLAPLVVHPRPAAAIALAVAGRPRAAALAVAVHVMVTARPLREIGVPGGVGARLALRGIADSAVAIGRAASMLAPVALAAGLAHRRTRPGTLCLLLAEPLRSWRRTRPALDPVRWSALCLADDLAYGAGVWAGAGRARTARPLIPALSRATARPARRSPPDAQ
jgi:mycofactocin glycosyltransferase